MAAEQPHPSSVLEVAPPRKRALPGVVSFSAFALLLGAFFLSGASALIYEIVWTRLLSLIFGVTIYAVSVVLASFMGGLAIGSLLAGRLADRVTGSLRYYAGIEALIGGLGVISPAAINNLTPVYVWLFEATGDSPEAATALRALLASALLLLPTSLMGATLPFMVRASLGRFPHLGENFSLLYALNTAGAAAGTLAAGFFLIGRLGFQGSVYVAALLNVGACLIALFLSLILGDTRVAATRRAGGGAAPPGPAEAPYPGVLRGLVLVGIGVSGFCALAYEILWFRILDLFFNGTAYAFSLMLFTFLVGLALGSGVSRLFIGRAWNWVVVLGLLEVLVGLEAAVALRLAGKVPLVREALAGMPALAPLLERPVFGMAVAGVLVLLPLTVLLGMTFPVAAQAVARGQQHVGTIIGRMSAANTFGAILGSLAGGFWLLPVMGTQWSIGSLALANVVLGVVLVGWALRSKARLAWAAPSAALLLVAPLSAPELLPEVYRNLFKDYQLLWHEEGLENTVSVLKNPQGYAMLFLNSREQASDSPGMVAFHEFLGHLPMLLHPDPQDVLIIGLGGGATPGAISRYRSAHLDVVELSPSVVRAAEVLSYMNNQVLARENVHVKVDDGRNYLLLSKKKYDVITADLIQPFHAGSGNLYSREYFRLVREALKEGGIMVQWMNPGLTTLYPLIARTFFSEFPYVTVWAYGTIFIGSMQPLNLDPAALQQRFQQEEVQEAARSLDLSQPADLLQRSFYDDGSKMRRAIGDGLVLTDDLPLTEYFRAVPGTPLSRLEEPLAAP
ncbi:MAG: fused MFS/spermidine synthase [Chloroflexi bacterium]|nr:fused MFS/spermidine synthase [Chloroflexota bacterium]